MMAYKYARIKNNLHGIAFKGWLACAMWTFGRTANLLER